MNSSLADVELPPLCLEPQTPDVCSCGTMLCRGLCERWGLLRNLILRAIAIIFRNIVLTYLDPHKMDHRLVWVHWQLVQDLECKVVSPTRMGVPFRLVWYIWSLSQMNGYRHRQHFSFWSASRGGRRHFTQCVAKLLHISRQIVNFALIDFNVRPPNVFSLALGGTNDKIFSNIVDLNWDAVWSVPVIGSSVTPWQTTMTTPGALIQHRTSHAHILLERGF